MTDKTREAIKAEVIKIINRNPADNFDLDGCVDRLSLLTAPSDGVTDEEIEAEAERRYATKSNRSESYNTAMEDMRVGFMTCARWLRSKLAAPKQDGWVSVDERLPDEADRVIGYFPNGAENGRKTVIARRNGYDVVQDAPGSSISYAFKATHWQPLPSPPKPSQP